MPSNPKSPHLGPVKVYMGLVFLNPASSMRLSSYCARISHFHQMQELLPHELCNYSPEGADLDAPKLFPATHN